MKKYIYAIPALLMGMMMVSCSDEQGTSAGGDSAPVVNVYQYSAEAPYDGDNDALVRIVANNKVSEVYYLAEKAADKEARNMTDADYASYVVSNGTKVTMTADEMTGGYCTDVYVTGLKGINDITVVGTDGSQLSYATTSFTGLDWQTVSEGTYYFSSRAQGRFGLPEATTTILQQESLDPTYYQFKNLYGDGGNLRFHSTGYEMSSDYGTLEVLRVAGQATPFEYGNYGTAYVRDLGYWQNDDSFAYDASYGCWMVVGDTQYKGVMQIAVQYYVSAGSLGYGWDYYYPN